MKGVKRGVLSLLLSLLLLAGSASAQWGSLSKKSRTAASADAVEGALAEGPWG